MSLFKRFRIPTILSLTLAVLILFACINQETTDSVEENNIELNTNDKKAHMQNEKNNDYKSIQLNSTDYNDLAFLKDILGNKRVVMLGESSHGVAEYSLIKSRLIKFLHEELNYNVVAFESGLADVNVTNELLLDNSPYRALEYALHGVWNTNNNVNLFKYLQEQKSSDKFIDMVGFDIQLQGYISQNSNILYEYFEGINKDFAENIKEAEIGYDELIKNGNNFWRKGFTELPTEWDEERKRLILQYENLLAILRNSDSQISRTLNDQHEKLFIKIFEQRIDCLTEIYNEEYFIQLNLTERKERRDAIMSENLIWLLEEMYPNEKFVIWAHNAHIMKNRSKVKIADGSVPFVNFVELLPDSIKNESFIIGLYMYSGQHTFNNREVFDVFENHKENSIENRLSQSKFSTTFLNIAIKDTPTIDYWWNSDTVGKAWGYLEETFIPSEQYDGLILIDQANRPIYQ
ncbi:erythromycin esterase family protein [Cytobacillus sp. IB215665]|uniref:erythromycin esterase family protein n=1 Tax=Cytobacillus sp. IB215665 TaxID=3097357 RepID=UPI002A1448CB|nr:erythromycin esterase family protein [Cytobacillus sp. IB215665]MDX8366591.1 erythromycin esterase family protein [Cytobacillus sp. IB215665]